MRSDGKVLFLILKADFDALLWWELMRDVVEPRIGNSVYLSGTKTGGVN